LNVLLNIILCRIHVGNYIKYYFTIDVINYKIIIVLILSSYSVETGLRLGLCPVKMAFHDADTDFLAKILERK